MSAYDDALRTINGVYMAEDGAAVALAAAQVYATLAIADAIAALAASITTAPEPERETRAPGQGGPE